MTKPQPPTPYDIPFGRDTQIKLDVIVAVPLEQRPHLGAMYEDERGGRWMAVSVQAGDPCRVILRLQSDARGSLAIPHVRGVPSTWTESSLKIHAEAPPEIGSLWRLQQLPSLVFTVLEVEPMGGKLWRVTFGNLRGERVPERAGPLQPVHDDCPLTRCCRCGAEGVPGNREDMPVCVPCYREILDDMRSLQPRPIRSVPGLVGSRLAAVELWAELNDLRVVGTFRPLVAYLAERPFLEVVLDNEGTVIKALLWERREEKT